METSSRFTFFLAACMLLCKGSCLGHSLRQSEFCDNWAPYLDDKCVKIVDATGTKNQVKAEMVCKSSYARLVTVKTSQQQQFLLQFLFDENQLVKNIWLGLKKNGDSTEFEWNDGSQLSFNNLIHQNISDNGYPCVVMASGEHKIKRGLWVRVDCEKNNAVVCERGPAMMNTSNITYMRDASEQVITQNELEEKILLKAEKECEEKFGILKQTSLQTRDFMKDAIDKLTTAIEHVNMAPERRIEHSLKQKSDFSHSLEDSPCGDWTPFKNEKCVKLVARTSLQTKEEGDTSCRALAKEVNGGEIPKLVTIKTEEKQNFLQKLLFEDLKTLDNVWLGLELGNDVFRWNDGTDLYFTNWIEDTRKGRERDCVQMESGEGISEKGKWVRANCKKKNLVVCERTQPWSVAALQNILLSLKLEVEQKFNEANKKFSEASREIESLKKNPVPIGFIYVQLPGQDPPTTLWPQTSWKDVGSDYAGLFFRVEGGNAAPFGELQEDNTRRLAEVVHDARSTWTSPKIPADGSWSDFTFSGSYHSPNHYGLKFRLTEGEIRPQNKAVKIWRRIK